MPRPEKPRKIANFKADDMIRAVEFVLAGGSIRQGATQFKVPRSTLQRYVERKRKASAGIEVRMEPNYAVNQVFTAELETMLKNYLVTCASMAYGLSSLRARKLAYELAMANKKKVPTSWETNKAAGKDWFRSFRKRNSLSLRKPEACSLSRLTSFNRKNVGQFFSNLKEVLKKYPELADPSRIYNLDETKTPTVQEPESIVAETGTKQLNAATSGERGILVTTCAIICATGTFLPPVMVFPRRHFKDHMINGAPAGTLGLANPSGWMSKELFPEVLKHFITHSHSSKDHRTLLIYDNLEAHLSIEVVDKARANGVSIVTLPPHCSHKMQPLDKAVFGPFRAAYNTACDNWLVSHPGKTITIFDVAGLVSWPFDKAFTPTNIKSGFSSTGIFPLNENIYTDNDFLQSAVTDRPPPIADNLDGPVLGDDDDVVDDNHQLISDCSRRNVMAIAPGSSTKVISPEAIRGYPKAGPRKVGKNKRKKYSTVITRTPEKNAQEQGAQEIEAPSSEVPKKTMIIGKKKLFFSPVEDADEDEEESDFSSSSSDEEVMEDTFFDKDPNPTPNKWVLVEYKGRKNIRLFYIGQVVVINGENLTINFLKKGNTQYSFPTVKDEGTVALSQVRKVLNEPLIHRGHYDFRCAFPQHLTYV